jgi:hypothetical protein
MGHLLGHDWVSKVGQDLALQRDAWVAAGCYRIFTDTASGALDARPALADGGLDDCSRAVCGYLVFLGAPRR